METQHKVPFSLRDLEFLLHLWAVLLLQLSILLLQEELGSLEVIYFKGMVLLQGLYSKECVLLELGIKITKDLLEILDTLYNRLLIILMMKQTEKQTNLTSRRMELQLVVVTQ
ncbi:MAG: hypothetical protein CL805_15335 [Citromicrobium sp.]|nr:hypothetical protein [Citromicrobium sp.]